MGRFPRVGPSGGEKCARIEIEKYGHPPVDDYIQRVAHWTWASFWLAVQLHQRKADHHGPAGTWRGTVSSLSCVCETKDLVIHEALARLRHANISHRTMESEDTLRAIESLEVVITEAQEACRRSKLKRLRLNLCRDGGRDSCNADGIHAAVLPRRQQDVQDHLGQPKDLHPERGPAGAISLPDHVGK